MCGSDSIKISKEDSHMNNNISSVDFIGSDGIYIEKDNNTSINKKSGIVTGILLIALGLLTFFDPLAISVLAVFPPRGLPGGCGPFCGRFLCRPGACRICPAAGRSAAGLGNPSHLRPARDAAPYAAKPAAPDLSSF